MLLISARRPLISGPRHPTFLYGVALACLTSIGGCNGGDRPELGTVQGRVSLNGGPLGRAMISFQPMDGGRQSCCVTNREGAYELVYLRNIRGAKVGNHRVTISTAIGDGSDQKEEIVPD